MCANGRRCGWATWWAVWGAAALGSLAVGELIGLRSGDPHGPLTPHLRAWLGIKPPRPWRLLGTAGLLGALTALAAHVLSDWP